jgi:glycerophosphoryl diester phosphodiesterase
VECIAHRGFAGVNPENTVLAVRAVAGSGADAVEVDARRCGSGEVVVCHDATVDRVTGASGPVSEYTAAELADLTVLGTGEGVPTLRAVVEATPADVGVNVELKERGLRASVRDVLAAHPGECWLSSFDPGALEAARTGEAEVPTALLAAPGDEGDPVRRARALDCAAVHPHHSQCTPGLVARAHEAGLAINAWTVRSEATAARLADAGVDGLIADAPAYCRRGSPGSGGA